MEPADRFTVTDRQRDLERIIDAAPDAIVLVDSDGRIEIVNVQAEQMFGLFRHST